MRQTGWLLKGPGTGFRAALGWRLVAERKNGKGGGETTRFFSPGEVDRLLIRLDGWQDATLPIAGLTNPKRLRKTNLS